MGWKCEVGFVMVCFTEALLKECEQVLTKIWIVCAASTRP
jgi:hypothetical protein